MLPVPAHLAALPLIPAGEKSLGVTIHEGSEEAVWNCFRAKCNWTGSVNVRQGLNNAYRRYTNESGAALECAVVALGCTV